MIERLTRDRTDGEYQAGFEPEPAVRPAAPEPAQYGSIANGDVEVVIE